MDKSVLWAELQICVYCIAQKDENSPVFCLKKWNFPFLKFILTFSIL